ncbi:hypothetical protein BigBertha_171 [Bacillus phage BigBertha]|uniref:Uncharacterized protein n=3 Tax=Bequatrovirus TaxID=1917990 RepID=U5PS18_9CAUD|nr:hypothetical protein TROLL_179 [Bacillus phage Troll]YP_008771198.1 hypothetical protein BigBertha_171 [Bacillus phage BigBertha]AGT13532.1 hypothetical protein TROLL_179 [Bacillus phage Troll]AGY46679.1 hypothetical protein BigBertha_171 [Bacillus phage BigBertha]AMW61700.1 hypothetical protein JUGLONE_175 [Bacillus phage Juglone]
METNNEKVLAKWYKTLEVKHELIIQKGGTNKLVLPVMSYPTDSDIEAALRLFGGHHAEIVTTTVERKPYSLISANDVDEFYGYNDELKAETGHIFQTSEIRKAVLARMKEDME